MAAGPRAASPCDGCDARCCSAYTVQVTGADAYRISRGTALDMVRFLAYLPQVERDDAGFLLEAGGPTHCLILASARTDERRTPCVFLRVDTAKGAVRCGIYPFRPAACQRFPVVRGDDGRALVRAGIICPDGAWGNHTMDRLSWRVALAREHREAGRYAAVVASWNARVEAEGRMRAWTVGAYLDHLRDAYAGNDPLRRGLPTRCNGPGTAVLT